LATARREALEELRIDAEFSVAGPRPLFLTVTTTVGRDDGHVDISLWYVIRGDRSREYALDPTEFDGGRWWDIDPYGLPESDPHFGRFLRKLDAALQSAKVRRLDG
jgi:8-oxo-dGTP diphosphatase